MLTRRRDGRLLLGAVCLALSVPLLWPRCRCRAGDLLTFALLLGARHAR